MPIEAVEPVHIPIGCAVFGSRPGGLDIIVDRAGQRDVAGCGGVCDYQGDSSKQVNLFVIVHRALPPHIKIIQLFNLEFKLGGLMAYGTDFFVNGVEIEYG